MKIIENHKLHIFISYSHTNTAQMDSLAGALSAVDDFEVRYDTGETQLPADTHREISNSLNWADVVIPIITQDWLNSHECRDELTRAHERRKKIIPFRKDDVSDDGPPKVPHYLREILFVTWGDRSIKTATHNLILRLQSEKLEQWKHKAFRDIRSLGNHVYSADAPPLWKTQIAKRIIHTSTNNVRRLLNSTEGTFDVSHDSAYLSLADPIFGTAESIIAVCVAQISTFWSNPDFRTIAFNYLGKQKDSAKNIARLFVFKSPEEANEYKNILQGHYLKYGARHPRNGVFLCSEDTYRHLAGRWAPEGNEPLREDHGLLWFSDQQHAIEAVLSKSEFRYREFDESDVLEAQNQLMIEQFDEFRTIDEGKLSEEYGIARWSPELWDDDSAFAKVLDGLFEERKGRIRHYVFLRPQRRSKHFEKYVYGLYNRLYQKRKEFRMRDFNIDTQLELKVFDGRFQGQIDVHKDFDFVLRAEFDNVEALQHYYGHPSHSVEREQLYVKLNPKISNLFKDIRSTSPSDSKLREKIYSTIENTMTHQGFIMRVDAIDDEPITSITQRPGIEFGSCRK